MLNGEMLSTKETGKNLLKELYQQSHTDYSKFYKMDGMCRLGFIASEVLLSSIEEQRFVPREDRAVVMITKHGCLVTDTHYEETIAPGETYFPSPAVFVYTLPNIVTGEIAIRNSYMGETMMYMMAEENAVRIGQLVQDTFTDTLTTSALVGWINYEDDNHFEAHIELINKQN